jgi:hypothetical protein
VLQEVGKGVVGKADKGEVAGRARWPYQVTRVTEP